MEIIDVLARNLRLYRNQADLSQEALADAAEIDRTYVSGLERGVRNPTVAVLAKLATALGVKPHELLIPPDLNG